jgi:hypothetical protein
VRYGRRAEGADDLASMYTRTRHDGFGPEVKRRIMLGTYALSSGYYDAYYGRAQKVRTKIAEDFRAAFAKVDMVVTPTAPGVAFELGAKTGDPLAMYLNDYFTVPMSLAGIPAISIPSGLSDGLPVGFQIAGPAFSENRILDVAHASRRRSASTAARRGLTMATEYEPVIGLEIHVQLGTRTKMFCSCALASASRPTRAPARCASGCPGRCPVVNARAIHYGLMIGMALGSELRGAVDLPPQELLLSRPAQGLPDQPVRRAPVQRRHARRRAHPPRARRGGRRPSSATSARAAHRRLDASVVDFNRGGTPLAEIVTEPDIRSASRPASG